MILNSPFKLNIYAKLIFNRERIAGILYKESCIFGLVTLVQLLFCIVGNYAQKRIYLLKDN